MTRLLDTHCHLGDYTDPGRVLREADAAGVDVVAVTDSPDSYRRLRTRLGPRASVTVALGLHPASASAAAPGQVERFLRMLPDATWIGEVGLDQRPGTPRSDARRQLRAFEAVLAHPLARIRPMTVHSRGAAKDTVRLLAQAPCNAVLHWYTGPASVADDALSAGLLFSVNAAMTGSAKGRELLARLPPERVLLETDGPYCCPAGTPSRPADVTAVVRELAALWETPVEQAAALLCRTAAALLAS